jgi:hypothetical protein
VVQGLAYATGSAWVAQAIHAASAWVLDVTCGALFALLWCVVNPILMGLLIDLTFRAEFVATLPLSDASGLFVSGVPMYLSVIIFLSAVPEIGARDREAFGVSGQLVAIAASVSDLVRRGIRRFHPRWALFHAALPSAVVLMWICMPPVLLGRVFLPAWGVAPEIAHEALRWGPPFWLLIVGLFLALDFAFVSLERFHGRVRDRLYRRSRVLQDYADDSSRPV